LNTKIIFVHKYFKIKIIFMIDQAMVTTNIELDGYKIVESLGVIRGITVRSRSVVGNIAGGLQSLFGGKLSIYVNLCETAREEAFQHMLQHAAERGANAIIAMRYDANEIMDGITEVLAYGTAVRAEKI
jgi:uncharacterized protein YbjQ (UPF0145 family)